MTATSPFAPGNAAEAVPAGTSRAISASVASRILTASPGGRLLSVRIRPQAEGLPSVRCRCRGRSPSPPRSPCGTSRGSCCSRACPASARSAGAPTSPRGPPRSPRTGSPRSTGSATAGGRAGSPTTSGARSSACPACGRDDLGLPPLALGRFEAWLEFDHARRTSRVRGDGERATISLRALRGGRRGAHRRTRRSREWHSSLPRPDYERAVQRAIDYIRAGDVFQVNLSQRLSARMGRRPVRALRAAARRRARRRSRRSCGSAAPT